jgi:hypothetical protein
MIFHIFPFDFFFYLIYSKKCRKDKETLQNTKINAEKVLSAIKLNKCDKKMKRLSLNIYVLVKLKIHLTKIYFYFQ